MSPIAGIGVDAVDVARFGEVLARRPGIAARLFTDAEQTAAAGDPQRLAARFAAKEATMKALGTGIGGFGWHDVELVRPPLGAPTLALHAAAATLADQRGVSRWHVSITHTTTVAVAMVVAED